METVARQIKGEILWARVCEPKFPQSVQKGMSQAQKLGLRYEKKVLRALELLTKSQPKSELKVLYQPWFEFEDESGYGCCAPDFVLTLGGRAINIVIDSKYTWTPLAETKMTKLYVPVVNKALEPLVLRSMTICKVLTPQSPKPIMNIGADTAFSITSTPVYHWPGQGKLLW